MIIQSHYHLSARCARPRRHTALLISSNLINPASATVDALQPPPAPEPPYTNPTMSLAVDQVTTNNPIPALAAGYQPRPIQKSRQYA